MLKLIATIALVATAAPAFAQPAGTTRAIHVSYADLDLRQAKDVRHLDHRLHAAVEAVCPDVPTTGSIINAETKRCRTAAFTALANQRNAAIAEATGGTQLAANIGRR